MRVFINVEGMCVRERERKKEREGERKRARDVLCVCAYV